MKKLVILLLFPFMAKSQTVDNAVKQIMKPQVDSLKLAIASIPTTTLPGNVYWDTVYVVNLTKAGNLDTLTSEGMYKLSVTGAISCVRLVYVAKSTTGILSIRTANPMALAGTGTFTTSIINNRVIVSTTATNVIYQREKL